MLNELSKETIEMILNNIKLMKSVKSELMSIRRVSPNNRRFICVGMYTHEFRDRDTINLNDGLCHNLNLFDLDCVNFKNPTDDLHKLGELYLITKGYKGQRSGLWPIENDGMYDHCYLNPDRWNYLDFVEKQMHHVLEHGHFSKSIGN